MSHNEEVEAEGEEERYKECPKCTVMTEKLSGCNKIDCVNCKTKWCFFCGLKYPNNRVKKKNPIGFCSDTGRHKHLPCIQTTVI